MGTANVKLFPGPGNPRPGSIDGDTEVVWSKDGREIFFHDGGYLQVAERVGSTTDFQFRPPRRLFPLPFGFQIAAGQWAAAWDVTPDGQRFLVTNPPPDAPASIAVVTNWDVE